MKKIFLLYFYWIISISTFGQFDYRSHKDGYDLNNNSEVEFTVFDTTQNKIFLIPKESLVDYSKLGDLAISKLYATNRHWAMSVYEDSTTENDTRDKAHFDNIKKLNPKNEFIRPICLYKYFVGKEEIALYFFVLHTDDVAGEIPMFLPAIKKNGRWYESYRLTMFSVNQIIQEFKEQTLEQIFNGNTSHSLQIEKLLKKVKTGEKIDMGKLFVELIAMKDNKDQTDCNYFTRRGERLKYTDIVKPKNSIIKTKVIQPMDLKCSIYDYNRDEYSVNGSKLKLWVSELAIFNNIPKGQTDTLKFLKRIIFYDSGNPIAIIKFKIGNKTKAEIIEFKNNLWQLSKRTEYENIRICMQYIKVGFWDSFEGFGRNKEQEIEKYLTLYKLPRHLINLDRLGEILKTKPKDLAPYCDFD